LICFAHGGLLIASAISDFTSMRDCYQKSILAKRINDSIYLTDKVINSIMEQ
jgi:hypothetical protein